MSDHQRTHSTMNAISPKPPTIPGIPTCWFWPIVSGAMNVCNDSPMPPRAHAPTHDDDCVLTFIVASS